MPLPSQCDSRADLGQAAILAQSFERVVESLCPITDRWRAGDSVVEVDLACAMW